jgi:hypothetical protein
MKNIILFVSILSLTGCSAEWHLRKAIQKDPKLRQPTTLTVHDTVIVPPTLVRDTVVTKDRDTVLIEKDRIRIKIVRVNDTLMVEGECVTDTIYRTIKVPVEQLVEKPGNRFWYIWGKYSFFALILVLVLRYLSKLMDRLSQ